MTEDKSRETRLSMWSERTLYKHLPVILFTSCVVTGAALVLLVLGIVNSDPLLRRLGLSGCLAGLLHLGFHLWYGAYLGRREFERLEAYTVWLRYYSVNNIEVLREVTDELKNVDSPKPPETVQQISDPEDTKPLGTKERNTLLVLIAVLSKEASIDITRPAKAAGLIQSLADKRGIGIGESTIEGVLKRIPSAVEARAR